MGKIASYIISAYSFIFQHPLEKLLDVGYQSKNGNPIPSFDEKSLIDLCSEVQNIFENEENLLEIDGDVIIVGDIHGSLHDLIRILNFIQENKSKVLFLGDYVDRGNFSLECITILFALKVLHPDHFYLIRGNHEFDQICSLYGFKDEILNHHIPKKIKNNQLHGNQILSNSMDQQTIENIIEKNEQAEQYEQYLADHIDMNCYKYSESLYNAFVNAFSYLPIGAIVNKSTFCIHGGLSPRLNMIESLNKMIKRPIFTFEENEIFTDVVWSDPDSKSSCIFGDNPRGHGYLFNVNAVTHFLTKNSLKRIIRGHECVKKGYLKHFNDKLITVFSASSYDKHSNNHSAVLKITDSNDDDDDDIQLIHFEPLERLQKCDASYYKVQSFEKNEMKLPTIFSLHHPILTTHASLRMVTHKKINMIPSQKSQNSSFFHDMNIKSHLPRPPIRSSSSFMLNNLCNHKNDATIIIPKRKDFSSSGILDDEVFS